MPYVNFAGVSGKIFMAAELITPRIVSGLAYPWLLNLGGPAPRQMIFGRSSYGNDYVDVGLGQESSPLPFPWGQDVYPDHD